MLHKFYWITNSVATGVLNTYVVQSAFCFYSEYSFQDSRNHNNHSFFFGQRFIDNIEADTIDLVWVL